ncbi:MAG: hypothetical protein IPJ88_05600 [Myxococcales bacterium]|nr:MAG: hypothetical protein IPJ88_05600 [Myxococcales bacterium]
MACCVFGLLSACTPQGDPAIAASGFRDDFERSELGPLWNKTGGNYSLVDGQLRVSGARNHPLWLKRRLPRDVRVELDVRSESEQGDIKVELFGDGKSHATSEHYTATSYVIILGGWSNTLNVIARMDEHGSDRVVGLKKRIEMGQVYHLRVERRGALVSVWLDGQKLGQMHDKQPLFGRGHDHFAFNNWGVETWFDNLHIEPL